MSGPVRTGLRLGPHRAFFWTLEFVAFYLTFLETMFREGEAPAEPCLGETPAQQKSFALPVSKPLL